MREDSLRKGPWYEEEDERLKAFVALLGGKRWDSLAQAAGLRRSGKSCRLRWLNYLRPSLKQGPISLEEEHIILQLHEKWGNKWAKIARRLPGRTDNEIKNYWRTHLRKKMQLQKIASHYFPSLATGAPSPSQTTFSSSDQTHICTQDAMSSEEKDTMIARDISSKDKEIISVDIELGSNDDYETVLPNYTDSTSSPYEQLLWNGVNDGSDIRFIDNPIAWNLGDWDYCGDAFWDMDLFTVNS